MAVVQSANALYRTPIVARTCAICAIHKLESYQLLRTTLNKSVVTNLYFVPITLLSLNYEYVKAENDPIVHSNVKKSNHRMMTKNDNNNITTIIII